MRSLKAAISKSSIPVVSNLYYCQPILSKLSVAAITLDGAHFKSLSSVIASFACQLLRGLDRTHSHSSWLRNRSSLHLARRRLTPSKTAHPSSRDPFHWADHWHSCNLFLPHISSPIFSSRYLLRYSTNSPASRRRSCSASKTSFSFIGCICRPPARCTHGSSSFGHNRSIHIIPRCLLLCYWCPRDRVIWSLFISPRLPKQKPSFDVW